MKLKNYILLLSLTVFTSFAHNYYKGEHCHLIDQEDTSLVKAYTTSIIPGIAIGGIGGALCAAIESKRPELWPFIWLIEICEREAMIEIVSADLWQKQVYHHKRIMELSAWISSWLSYLAMNNH